MAVFGNTGVWERYLSLLFVLFYPRNVKKKKTELAFMRLTLEAVPILPMRALVLLFQEDKKKEEESQGSIDVKPSPKKRGRPKKQEDGKKTRVTRSLVSVHDSLENVAFARNLIV